MKKGIIFALLTLFSVALFFVSCEKEDDTTQEEIKGCACRGYDENGEYNGHSGTYNGEKWNQIQKQQGVTDCGGLQNILQSQGTWGATVTCKEL